MGKNDKAMDSETEIVSPSVKKNGSSKSLSEKSFGITQTEKVDKSRSRYIEESHQKLGTIPTTESLLPTTKVNAINTYSTLADAVRKEIKLSKKGGPKVDYVTLEEEDYNSPMTKIEKKPGDLTFINELVSELPNRVSYPKTTLNRTLKHVKTRVRIKREFTKSV